MPTNHRPRKLDAELTVRLPAAELRRLDDLAIRMQTSRATVARIMISASLNRASEVLRNSVAA